VPVLASIASAAAGAPATMVGAGTVAAPAAVSAVPMLSVVKAVGGRGIAAGTAAAATGAAASVRSAATGAAGAAGAVGAAGVAVKPYTSYADGIRTIFRTEGIGGFYKGLTASYWGVTETALHFVVYEALKKRVAAHNIAKAAAGGRETESDKLGQLSSIQLLCSAATSKLLASVCTYPYVTVVLCRPCVAWFMWRLSFVLVSFVLAPELWGVLMGIVSRRSSCGRIFAVPILRRLCTDSLALLCF